MADTEDAATSDELDEDIPKLPRAPLFGKPSLHGVVRAGMFATLLYAIIVMRRPCAEGVGRFIGGFDDAPDAGSANITDHYPGYELMSAEEALKRWPDSPGIDAGPALDAGLIDTASVADASAAAPSPD